MEYLVLHATRYEYQAPVVESVMEVRKAPRHDAHQVRLELEIRVEPAARVHHYRDPVGNDVHHFDIPQPHDSLLVVSRSRVRVDPVRLDTEVPTGTFEELDRATARGEHWEFLQESRYARATARVRAFAAEFGLRREGDPLATMRRLTDTLNREMAYVPQSTRVDTSTDEAVADRRGVCQDFAHLEATLARLSGIPCRYVSGYLAATGTRDDRPGESHAWVEAWLPGIGWTGFDPTHNIVTGVHHIRVAVGRDYADVPPTRGVCKGEALGRLTVAVHVWEAGAAPREIDVDAMLAKARSVPARGAASPPDLPLLDPPQQQQQ
jgi:transglutaminase-like putative cysteine protease